MPENLQVENKHRYGSLHSI